MRTAAELAQAVWDEEVEFDDALLEYLGDHHPDRLEDTSFFTVMSIAIGYAAMGRWEKLIPISDDEKMTVKDTIDKFGLGPFVDSDEIPGSL